MDNMTIGFIGAGRVTAFMIEGLRRGQMDHSITVMDANPEISKKLASTIPSLSDAGSDYGTIGKSDILFIALHPQNAQEACESLAPVLGKETIVVSLAPKIPIASLSAWLRTDKIARYLPNAATSEGTGYNPIVWAESLSEKERATVRKLLTPLGDMPDVKETDIETYAVLSAMGPTYLWPLLDEMIESGKRYGLAADESARVVSRMAVACAAMIEHSGKDYDTRMNMIPSKPMADIEQDLRGLFRAKLDAIRAKLKG